MPQLPHREASLAVPKEPVKTASTSAVTVEPTQPLNLTIQVRDPASGQVIKRTVNIPVAIDEGLLKRIAAQTGGEFFRATDPNSLRTIFERIDRLEKSEIKISSYRRYRELYPPVLALAGLLLSGAGLLWLSGLRVAPA
jgi:hypothetical protein